MHTVKYLFLDCKEGFYDKQLKFICIVLGVVLVGLVSIYTGLFSIAPKIKSMHTVDIANTQTVVYSSEVDEFNSLATSLLYFEDNLTNAEMVEKYNRLSLLMKSAVPYTPDNISSDEIYFNEFTVLSTEVDSMLGYMVSFTNGDTLYTPKETNLLLGDKIEIYFTKEKPNSLITNFTTVKEIK